MKAAGALVLAFFCSADAGELVDAAERGDGQEVARLVSGPADVDARQADGTSALIWAAWHDDVDMARLLLSKGAAANLANHYGATPLGLACENGSAAMVTLLLEAGAEVDARQAGGSTPLMIAVETGRPECVRILLESGAGVDVRDGRGQSAVMRAAAAGHAPVVGMLIEAGADWRQALESGFTPLLFAVRAGHADVVEVLLENGAEVNAAAEPKHAGGRAMRRGTSPLMLAVENGHLELALNLVDAGADPDDQRSGFTPLHALTWVRKAPKGDGPDGIPPPEISGKTGTLEFARKLVERGADVNARLAAGGGALTLKGATPFFMAAATDDLPLLETLLELGADPAIPNATNTSPLLAAAGVGVHAPGEEPGTEDEAYDTVAYLIDLGADVNAVDARGETAMHGAAYKAVPKVIDLLDERGADISVWNRPNKSGWTPLLIAQGFRPGNFRPIAETIEAIGEVMRRHGVEPPPPPERGG